MYQLHSAPGEEKNSYGSNGFSNAETQTFPTVKCKSCTAIERVVLLFIFHSQICSHVLTICVRGKLKQKVEGKR
jgi:hypothetical protein